MNKTTLKPEPTPPPAPKKAPPKGLSAVEMGAKQREISVSEFFTKNRHLLGFDSPRKALLTCVKEAVDNALDACEEADILPEVDVKIEAVTPEGQAPVAVAQANRFRVTVVDYGPGIVREHIPRIFAKLLYGSKFHRLRMSRGQQGIGISAAVLYAQLTTGRPAKIWSKIGANQPAHYYELHIDTQSNKPSIVKEEIVEWAAEHGTRVEIDLEAEYLKGNQSVDEYLKQTAVINPHVTIIYTNPKSEQVIYARATDKLPAQAQEIKPHPHGIELGMLMDKLKWTESRTLQSFLTSEFSRVGPGTAKQICENAALLTNTKPKEVSREMAEKLMEGIKKTKIISPPTDCISPIGAELLEKGLRKEINAEFYAAATRPPQVYRGNPFIIEAGIAYGGEQNAEESAKLLRYANRVPLLYQQGACAVTRSVINTAWRNYGMSQSKGALPFGPITIAIHIASVWVPFTSESKEAIAHYPEIIKEIKLALQECGRQLASYIGKKKRLQFEGKKRDYIKTFIPHVGEALKELLKLKDADEKKVEELLAEILEKQRGKMEEIEDSNEEYDEEFAKIGKSEEGETQDEEGKE